MFPFRKVSDVKKPKPPKSRFTRRLCMPEMLEGRQLLTGELVMTLVPPTANPVPTGDMFGQGVAASGDLIAVGSPGKDVGTLLNVGSVNVYDRGSSAPGTPIVTIFNPEPGNGQSGSIQDIGTSVALSGNLLAVGAPYNDPGGITDAGTVFVYDLGSATPTVPIFKIDNPAADQEDLFGFSVAISSEFLVVGAPGSDVVAQNGGNAYAFNLRAANPNTTVFQLNRGGAGAGDNFGFSVAIAGYTAAVGSPLADGANDDEGRAFVYNLWSPARSTPIRTYADPTPGFDEQFGKAVSVSGSNLEKYQRPEPPTTDNLVAHYVAVGAPYNLRRQNATDLVRPGAAYVFNAASTSTAPFYTVLNPNPAPPAPPNNDEFGDSIALTRNYLVVGAHAFDRTAAQTQLETGAAYIYELNSTNVAATLLSPTAAARDFFGEGVAASGNLAVVGIPGADTQATDQGSAMVFTLDSPEQKRGELIRFDSINGIWTGMDFRVIGTVTPQQRVLEVWRGGTFWKTALSGDFDGDGHFDLAAETTAGQWWVKLSSNSASAPLGYWANNMTSIQVADVNGDGLDDIAGFLPTESSWWGLISNGSFFTLTYLTAWAPTTTFANPFVADFMNDGTADIVGRDTNTGLWWIDNRIRDNVTKVVTSTRFVWGQWARTIGGNTITWQDVRIGDFTGDGRPDIAGRLDVAPATNAEWWVSARPGNSLAAHQMVGVWVKSRGYNNAHLDLIRQGTRADIFGQTSTGIWTSGGQTPFADVFTAPVVVGRSYVSDVAGSATDEILMVSNDNRVRVVNGRTATWTVLNTYTWTFGIWLFEGTEDRLW